MKIVITSTSLDRQSGRFIVVGAGLAFSLISFDEHIMYLTECYNKLWKPIGTKAVSTLQNVL